MEYYDWPPFTNRFVFEGEFHEFHEGSLGLFQLLVIARGARDAIFYFTNCEGCYHYEIVIGGWGNSESTIRNKKDDPDYVLTPVRHFIDKSKL